MHVHYSSLKRKFRPVCTGSLAAWTLHSKQSKSPRARVQGSAAWLPGPTKTHVALRFLPQLTKTRSLAAGGHHWHQSGGGPRGAPLLPHLWAQQPLASPLASPYSTGGLQLPWWRRMPVLCRLSTRSSPSRARGPFRGDPGRASWAMADSAGPFGPQRGDGVAAPRAERSPGRDAGPAGRWQWVAVAKKLPKAPGGARGGRGGGGA